MNRSHNKKGIIYTWMVILIGIFACTFMWIIFSQIYVVNIFPWAETQLINDSNATATLKVLESVWNYWPLMLVFGLIMYGLVSAGKKEPDAGYYYQ